MPQLNSTFAQLDELIRQDTVSIREMRRFLHAHPEPSGEETQTTAYIADQLSALNVAYRMGPEGRGLIVDFPKEGTHRLVAFRADIDALRLQDEKTVSYRSRESNLMHACGHDAFDLRQGSPGYHVPGPGGGFLGGLEKAAPGNVIRKGPR